MLDDNRGMNRRPQVEQWQETVARLARENATRVPCRYCGVRCLPETLSRHESFHA